MYMIVMSKQDGGDEKVPVNVGSFKWALCLQNYGEVIAIIIIIIHLLCFGVA
jgi:hypothetical protein